jgi:uncharacterized integral membrane protein (TIGR00697 family)
MFHVSALVLGFVLGNKSTDLGPFIVTLTLLSYPVVILTTDLINEYGGHRLARRVTAAAFACVVMIYVLIEVAQRIPAAASTHLPPGAFDHAVVVPGIDVVALLSGYAGGQLADIEIFHRLRSRSGSRLLWLRVVASTTVGEIVDALVVTAILLAAPDALSDRMPSNLLLEVTRNQAAFRIVFAVALLPVVYLFHHFVAQHCVQATASED